jgi:uncharacterized protein YndB with AHSA1/START domain
MDEFTMEIEAPPAKVWGLVSDVTNMGRWSPECHRCEWIDGASGPVVGAKFKGWNKRGRLSWSTVSTVVTADEPREFAWTVDGSGMRWGYRFDETASGTRVTEFREEIGPKSLKARLGYKLGLLGKDPDAIVRSGMQETLQRLKAGAESST